MDKPSVGFITEIIAVKRRIIMGFQQDKIQEIKQKVNEIEYNIQIGNQALADSLLTALLDDVNLLKMMTIVEKKQLLSTSYSE